MATRPAAQLGKPLSPPLRAVLGLVCVMPAPLVLLVPVPLGLVWHPRRHGLERLFPLSPACQHVHVSLGAGHTLPCRTIARNRMCRLSSRAKLRTSVHCRCCQCCQGRERTSHPMRQGMQQRSQRALEQEVRQGCKRACQTRSQSTQHRQCWEAGAHLRLCLWSLCGGLPSC